MNNIFKYLSAVLIFLLLIVLITVLIQLGSKSDKNLSFSDLDSILDNIVAAGVTQKSFDKNDPLLERRHIIISSTINEHAASDVTAKLLYLDAISHDSIYLLISSNGGWGICAKQIIETMNIIESPVNTVIIGSCFSASALISVSATGKKYATPNSIIMIHANLDKPEYDKSYNSYYNEWYESILKNLTDLPSDWFPMTNSKEHYFNAEDAVKYKFIDQIISREDKIVRVPAKELLKEREKENSNPK